MGALENVKALLRPLRRRLALIIGHGTVQLVNDAPMIQRVQCDFLVGETRGELRRFGEFGFTSFPPKGSEAVAVFQAGDRSNGVIVAVEDGRKRPRGLQEGESAAYNAHGILMLFARDQTVQLTAVRLEVSGSIESQEDVSDATGTLAEVRQALEQLRQAYNIHTHAGVQSGSDATAPPLPQD